MQEDSVRQRAEHLRGLALDLFDCTRTYHGFGEEQRRLLGWGAALQDQLPVREKKKALQAVQTWLDGQMEGDFSSIEQAVLAGLVIYARGKFKQKEVSQLNLSSDQQHELLVLGALLRIAVGLDDSNSQQTSLQRAEPGPFGIWVLVEGPHAASDAAAAQKSATLWMKTGYPRLKIVEASAAEKELLRATPLPTPRARTGIDPSDPMAEAGRKVLLFHFAEMLRHEEGTRLGEDIEALHDMRVATRRMRAAFEIFGEAFEPQAIKPHLKGLRATGRALGRVRDLDVFMEKAQHYLETLPENNRDGLEPLLHDWRAQRELARAEMLAHLNSESYHHFKWAFNEFLSTSGAGARPAAPDQPAPSAVREIAPVLIYTRLAEVRAYDRILEHASIEQHHALRIEFKKLRYTVEFFREVLGEEVKPVINALKKMQDHLGDLNDADVATLILHNFLNEWEIQQTGLPVGERQNPEAIVTYLAARHTERHQLMASFREAWESFIRPEFRRNLALAVSAL